MGEGIALCALGIQNNPMKVYWGNTLFSGIWNRSNNPTWSRPPNFKNDASWIWDNDAALEEALDFAEEKRYIAFIRLANYQQSLSKQRHGQWNPREFEISSLVLRRNMGSMIDPTHGKLVAN